MHCKITDTVNLDFQPLKKFLADFRDTSICEGDSIVLNAIIPSVSNYKWNNGESNPIITVKNEGKFIISAFDDLCYTRDSLYINVDSPYVVDLGKDTLLCEGNQLKLNVPVSGANYIWQDGSSKPDFIVKTPGTYFVFVKKGNCRIGDSIDVAYQARPAVELGRDTVLCEGNQINIKLDFPGYSIFWNDSSTASSRLISAPGGSFKVSLSDNICKVTDSIKIAFAAVPVIDLGPDTIVCVQFKMKLGAIAEYAQYLWQDGSKKDSIMVYRAGAYKLTVTNPCGTFSDEKLVDFSSCNLKVPSAFTPNGDALNERFLPLGHGTEILEMRIYNRWGELIHSESGNVKGWDGTYNGTFCAEGVYFWQISYLAGSEHKNIQGSFTLIR